MRIYNGSVNKLLVSYNTYGKDYLPFFMFGEEVSFY